MNAVRVPIIAGLADGVGTSTLAAAVHGHDRGRYSAGPVDVLVCRLGSLAETATAPGVPVLVVVADAATAAAEPTRSRIRRIHSRFGAVVLLPHMGRPHEAANPLSAAAGLLGLPPDLRPPALRSYADGLLAIVDALLRSGCLLRPAGPFPAERAARPSRLRGAPPVLGAPPASIVPPVSDPPSPPGPPQAPGALPPPRAPRVQRRPLPMDDLEAKVFGRFDEDTWFYPGHGNDSTLGAERPAIPEWRARGW